MEYNYLDKIGLTTFWAKIKEKFVTKEHKTGSDSEYKVLSDNNLTDELLEKLQNAGSSSFSGQYNDLSGKPSIEGHELVSGNNTAASLGLATASDISNATSDMATKTWVNGRGFAKTTEVAQQINSATSDMATQTWVNAKGYQNATQVNTAITAATANTATQNWVESKGYATTSSVNSAIQSAVAGAYKAKGSVAFASLPAISSAAVGDVYNITDQFSTTSDFVEGSGKSYSAGTNVVCVDMGSGSKKWDVLTGFVDLSKYVADSDMVAISDEDINDICV